VLKLIDGYVQSSSRVLYHEPGYFNEERISVKDGSPFLIMRSTPLSLMQILVVSRSVSWHTWDRRLPNSNILYDEISTRRYTPDSKTASRQLKKTNTPKQDIKVNFLQTRSRWLSSAPLSQTFTLISCQAEEQWLPIINHLHERNVFDRPLARRGQLHYEKAWSFSKICENGGWLRREIEVQIL
jgi:hypothetical protein